ncbi:MAG: two-component system response regulator [Ignavibacteriae bacterium HGW-Ignavibacteriae-4]|jgi:two-component system phosphate regulon response regulator PhoB/two-component system alkaline phosphatase synthesis response regulator PhoP|nr:MAG: two-component system response regulator [Ignavibacteriae bacterium HGW-Ignavibacteriae-4]
MEENILPEKSLFSNKVLKTIAIVDDEPDIVELVSIHLKKSGYKTAEFESGEGFFKHIKSNNVDLVILDLMLPDSDGFEICKFLKNEPDYSNIPVIMLTARGDETEKILGLELGADDYVTKPFSPRELVARVKAVLRRNEKKTPDINKIYIGETLEIDLNKYEVKINNKKIELTSSEYKILNLLSNKKGWVYSREQILDYLGVSDKGVLDRTVDVHIKNLREKLGQYGLFIKNIRGVGYKLEEF